MGPLRRAAGSLKSSVEGGGSRAATGEGSSAGTDAAASASTSAAASSANSSPPAWARRMKRAQTMNHGTSAAAHAIRSGDRGGGGASVDLSEGE
jgi:type IV secretion system protein TrbL